MQFQNAGQAADNISVTIVASDPGAKQRAINGFDRSGIKIDHTFLIGDVTVDQLSQGAVWVELAEDHGEALDSWLIAFNAQMDVSSGTAVVSVTPDLVDVVLAKIDSDVEVLVAPSDLERAAEIALLDSRGQSRASSREDSMVRDSGRLRQLSDEVARIAETLARLSHEGTGGLGVSPLQGVGQAAEAPVEEGVPDIRADRVRTTIRARRLREKYFEKSYFADPAWDMLLDLLAAEIAQHRVPVSSLCVAAEVPATTALRWMKTMTDAGVFRRRSDPHDGRRVFVELSEEASLAMRRYFAELDGKLVA